MQVVVNVDDLGLHPAVRRAVEALAARGSVTSASVLANGPDVRAATRVRGVSLGARYGVGDSKELTLIIAAQLDSSVIWLPAVILYNWIAGAPDK